MPDSIFSGATARTEAAQARLKQLQQEGMEAYETDIGWLSPLLTAGGAIVGGFASMGNPAGIAAGAAAGKALGSGVEALAGSKGASPQQFSQDLGGAVSKTTTAAQGGGGAPAPQTPAMQQGAQSVGRAIGGGLSSASGALNRGSDQLGFAGDELEQAYLRGKATYARMGS